MPFRILLAALAVSLTLASSVHAAGNGSQPNGKPFQALQSDVQDLQDQIDDLVARVDSVEDRVTANEDAIALLTQENDDLQQQIYNNDGDIDDLQAQIDNNNALINALQDEIDQINTVLATKQDILDGQCPPGYSLRVIQPDGSIVCEYDNTGVGGNIARTQVMANITIPAGAWRSNNSQCPAGYTIASAGWHTHNMQIDDFRPVGNGWSWLVRNTSGYTNHFVSILNCLRIY